MKQMEFVTIEELSQECARMFLEGIRLEVPKPAEKPAPQRKVVRKQASGRSDAPKPARLRAKAK